MKRPLIVMLLCGLCGAGVGLSHAQVAGTQTSTDPAVLRRASATPGYVFPKEPGGVRSLALTSQPGERSILRIRPRLLNADEPTSPGRAPVTEPPDLLRRHYQNENPPRLNVVFASGSGVTSRDEQMQAQALSRRGQLPYGSGGRYPVMLGFSLGNGAVWNGGPGGGGFAMIGVR